MAYREVTEYHLTYQDHPVIWVKVEGESYVHMITPAANDAVFVAEMLRNEKPVYYDSARNVLSTEAEEVGEEGT